jgi:hypothetical protein
MNVMVIEQLLTLQRREAFKLYSINLTKTKTVLKK